MQYHIATEVSTMALHFALGRWHWDTGRVEARSYEQWLQYLASQQVRPEPEAAEPATGLFTITHSTHSTVSGLGP